MTWLGRKEFPGCRDDVRRGHRPKREGGVAGGPGRGRPYSVSFGAAKVKPEEGAKSHEGRRGAGPFRQEPCETVNSLCGVHVRL